jgi:hypothetical protein
MGGEVNWAVCFIINFPIIASVRWRSDWLKPKCLGKSVVSTGGGSSIQRAIVVLFVLFH